jgi:hypothetical protein
MQGAAMLGEAWMLSITFSFAFLKNARMHFFRDF